MKNLDVILLLDILFYILFLPSNLSKSVSYQVFSSPCGSQIYSMSQSNYSKLQTSSRKARNRNATQWSYKIFSNIIFTSIRDIKDALNESTINPVSSLQHRMYIYLQPAQTSGWTHWCTTHKKNQERFVSAQGEIYADVPQSRVQLCHIFFVSPFHFRIIPHSMLLVIFLQ